METALVLISVVCLCISAWTIISKFLRVKNADKITFVKDGKSITISANPSKEDRIKLVNL
jgi:hypothetical protein